VIVDPIDVDCPWRTLSQAPPASAFSFIPSSSPLPLYWPSGSCLRGPRKTSSERPSERTMKQDLGEAYRRISRPTEYVFRYNLSLACPLPWLADQWFTWIIPNTSYDLILKYLNQKESRAVEVLSIFVKINRIKNWIMKVFGAIQMNIHVRGTKSMSTWLVAKRYVRCCDFFTTFLTLSFCQCRLLWCSILTKKSVWTVRRKSQFTK
jgi:hypothetical protein